jgi:hypothetical protein
MAGVVASLQTPLMVSRQLLTLTPVSQLEMGSTNRLFKWPAGLLPRLTTVNSPMVTGVFAPNTWRRSPNGWLFQTGC